MGNNRSTNEERIQTYLAQRGGSVRDSRGRGLSDDIARAVGIDERDVVDALKQMEDDGTVTREVRGFRTSRIALVDVGASPEVQAQGSSPVSDNTPQADLSPRAGAVKLRDVLAQPPSSVRAPPVVALPGVETSAPEPAEDDAPQVDQPEPRPGRAMSLREAIAQQSTMTTPVPLERRAGVTARPAGQPATRAESTGGDVPGFAGTAVVDAPQRPTVGRQKVSLRDTSGIDTGGMAASEAADDERRGARYRAKRSWSWPRLRMPLPEVKTPPTRKIEIGVGAAMVSLVLFTIVAVAVYRGPTHPSRAYGSEYSSDDACHVVNTDAATAAFGNNAGPPHYVLGSCIYDNGTHKLIASVARQNGRALFESSRGPAATNILGIGDRAYYLDGRLRVLKGSTLMLVTLSPYSAVAPSPNLLALAKSAVIGL